MTRIGFIGVGTMGLPMAANLVKKGFAVTAYDLNTEAVKAAVAAGMTAAASAAEAVAGADIVVTMLPSSPHVESAYGGDGGIINAARKGTLCVDMSTVDPAASRRVAALAAERGIRFIDAPVSGGTPRATDGTLAIMVGGSAEDFKAALPALHVLGLLFLLISFWAIYERGYVDNDLIADAIFTDHLGEPFEQKLTELYPRPESAGDDKSDKDKDDNGKQAPRMSSFGRGKGTIFLVELKSRAVIWSAYQKSNGSAPGTLDRTASQIVQQIKKQKGK
jgi:hypothetical protein